MMPTVRLECSPAPAHVRTARLVAVAVARRAGVPEPVLDEVRLAIGEACSRAVALHRRYGLPDLVTVEMSDGARFSAKVVDRAPREETFGGAGELPDPLALVEEDSRAEDDDKVAIGMRLALLAGLVDDLEVAPAPGSVGTVVRMSWPVHDTELR